MLEWATVWVIINFVHAITNYKMPKVKTWHMGAVQYGDDAHIFLY